MKSKFPKQRYAIGFQHEAVRQMEVEVEGKNPAQMAREFGIALAYMQKYWRSLARYIERGDLPIDNNRCENAVRPFVVGRKGWLFGQPAGAYSSAVIYSLVQTAKANGLEPYLWLRHVMRRLPAANADV